MTVGSGGGEEGEAATGEWSQGGEVAVVEGEDGAGVVAVGEHDEAGVGDPDGVVVVAMALVVRRCPMLD